MGFSLLFLGLAYLQDAADALELNTRVANLLSNIDCDRYYAILLFVLVGAVITAVVQSSAATTLMVVGFVNSAMMRLRQAIAQWRGSNPPAPFRRLPYEGKPPRDSDRLRRCSAP